MSEAKYILYAKAHSSTTVLWKNKSGEYFLEFPTAKRLKRLYIHPSGLADHIQESGGKYERLWEKYFVK